MYLGGTFGVLGAINNPGQFVGDSNLAGDLVTHAFLGSEVNSLWGESHRENAGPWQ